MDTQDFNAITLDQLRAQGGLKWRAFPDCIGAFVAEMDYGVAAPIARALADAVDQGQLGYLTAERVHEMTEACARWQNQHHAWDINAAAIRAVPDVLTALEVTLRYYLPAGAPVALPVPCYMPFMPLLEQVGHPVIPVPMRNDGQEWVLDEDALDAAFVAGARMLVLCNPYNPLGKVFTRAELEGISAVVARHDGRVFADEIHAPLVYSGGRHIAYASISDTAAHQAITALSASKTWNLAGLKCAQLVFTRAEDMQHWRSIGHFAGGATSTPGVIAHTAAWSQGEPWRRQVLDYLEGNRTLLGQFLAEHLPQIGYLPPQGTYLTWLDCRALDLPGSPQAFFRRQAKVVLTDGAECGPGGEGHVRLNLAMPRPLLEQALQAMAEAVGSR